MSPGTVAILPPGALGVSFFHHLTGLSQRTEGTYLVGLEGSRSVGALARDGIAIVDGAEGEPRCLSPQGLLFASLGAAWDAGVRPQVLVACPNPDQLLSIVTSLVEVIERVASQSGEEWQEQIPIVVLSSNGIYFQRVRQMFLEKLEESTLLGRLPDLWPDAMPRIVGRLLRGVTMQTGVRRGRGQGTVYLPGPPGLSLLAGGAPESRARCQAILAGRGGWFELAPDSSPTRLEFEKAMVNLMGNLLGLTYALGDDGSFRPLCLGEILTHEREGEMRHLIQRVFEVGVAVKVFGPSEDYEAIADAILAKSRAVGTHVPSTLQAVALQIEAGRLKAEFPPTETWLIDPLIRYARSSGLEDAASYFEGLRSALIHKLERAVQKQSAES